MNGNAAERRLGHEGGRRPPQVRAGDVPGASAGPDGEWVKVIASLARELEGMRASARLRAVIEQAKGILVAQHHLTLDEAFDRLRQMSQDHNVRLVEVAATLVGANLPPGAPLGVDIDAEVEQASSATSPEWRAIRTQTDLLAGRGHAVVHAMSTAVRDAREAGELLHALSAPLGVESVALYRFAPDGSLRLVAWHGFPDDWMKGWLAIPPGVDIPLMRCAVERTTIALSSLAERARRFPALLTMRIGGEATVNVPVVDGDEVTGSVIFAWPTPRDFDEETVRRAEQLAQTAGPILVRHATAVDPDLIWLRAVLETLFDPWLLLDPVIDDGALSGFRVTGASGLIPDAKGVLGRRLLEVWPALGPLGVFDRLFRVETTGTPWVERLTADQVAGLPLSGDIVDIRAIRLGNRVLVHWRAEDVWRTDEPPSPRASRHLPLRDARR